MKAKEYFFVDDLTVNSVIRKFSSEGVLLLTHPLEKSKFICVSPKFLKRFTPYKNPPRLCRERLGEEWGKNRYFKGKITKYPYAIAPFQWRVIPTVKKTNSIIRQIENARRFLKEREGAYRTVVHTL